MAQTASVGATSPLRGIAAMATAVVVFSLADAMAKWLGIAGFHAVQIVFLRYLFGLIPVVMAVTVVGVTALRTDRPFAHAWRGLLMCLSLVLFFWGLRHVPLGEAIAVSFTAPLFITALAQPILGERVGPDRWTAVVAGFIGTLVILRPGGEAFRPEALLIVASALVFAVAMLYTRRIAATESSITIFAYTTVVAGLATAPFAALTWLPPEPAELGLFLALGLIGGAAHFLVIVAYRNAPAAVNAPFEYTAILWASMLGWLLWKEAPGPMLWGGASIIAGAGLYIIFREAGAARR